MFSMEITTGLYYFFRVSICTEVAKVVSSLFVFPLKFPCISHPFQVRTTDPVQLIIFHLIAFITPVLLPSSWVQTLSSYAFIKHFQFMFFYQCEKQRERERERESERGSEKERERERVCVCVWCVVTRVKAVDHFCFTFSAYCRQWNVELKNRRSTSFHFVFRLSWRLISGEPAAVLEDVREIIFIILWNNSIFHERKLHVDL